MSTAFFQSTILNFLKLRYGFDLNLNKLQDLINKFNTNYSLDNICNNPKAAQIAKDINNIIKQLNSLIRILTSLLNVLQGILRFVNFIRNFLAALLVLIQVLKFLPAPATFSPIGFILKLGDLLSKITFQLAAGLVLVTGLSILINFLANAINALITKAKGMIVQLQPIADKLISCGFGGDTSLIDENGNLTSLSGIGTDLNNSLNDFNSLLNDLNNQIGSLLNSNTSYKGFTFEIKEEQTLVTQVAKRRQALAFNSDKVLALVGELSFATDTQVLIDELKLRIDTENLVGYPSNTPNSKGQDASILQLQTDIAKELGYNQSEIINNYNSVKSDIDTYISQDPNTSELLDKYTNNQSRLNN